MTNNQAEAYAKIAMQDAKLDKETIDVVLEYMRWRFDTMTEEQAERKAWRSGT